MCSTGAGCCPGAGDLPGEQAKLFGKRQKRFDLGRFFGGDRGRSELSDEHTVRGGQTFQPSSGVDCSRKARIADPDPAENLLYPGAGDFYDPGLPKDGCKVFKPEHPVERVVPLTVEAGERPVDRLPECFRCPFPGEPIGGILMRQCRIPLPCRIEASAEPVRSGLEIGEKLNTRPREVSSGDRIAHLLAKPGLPGASPVRSPRERPDARILRHVLLSLDTNQYTSIFHRRPPARVRSIASAGSSTASPPRPPPSGAAGRGSRTPRSAPACCTATPSCRSSSRTPPR